MCDVRMTLLVIVKNWELYLDFGFITIISCLCYKLVGLLSTTILDINA